MVQTTNDTELMPVEGSKALSMLLAAIGAIALATSIWMNARFGWGLSPDFADRTALAVLHALVDPAAAGITAAGGLMVRWGWRRQGMGALTFAALLIAYSMLSVSGFMSARIATTQSHDAVMEVQKSQLDWTLKSSIMREVPREERRFLHDEARDLSRKIEASLSIIPDAQAASIASALGISVTKVQRGLVMISSGVAQTIKFVSFLIAVTIWPQRHCAEKTVALSHEKSRPFSDAASASMRPASAASIPASPASLQAASLLTAHPLPASLAPCAAMQKASPCSPAIQKTASATSASKMPLDKLNEYLGKHASGMVPPLSQRQMALETGWHQSSVSRKMRQILRRTTHRVAAHPGKSVGTASWQ
jgi:hypothetical protein